MKFWLIVATCCLCGVAFAKSAQARDRTSKTVGPAQITASRPQLVFNVDTGAVIRARHVNQSWYPASLTKLMTAYVTFEAIKSRALKPGDRVRVSKRAHNQPPSRTGLSVGVEVRVQDALKLLIVKSANDIAVALAERVAGSEAAFVGRMNQAAARLGMNNTRFINPHGLPGKGQYTTAHDLGLLARALLRDYPQHASLFALSAVALDDKVLRSHNSLLLTYPGATGMKTGFICAAGYNLVASARRGRTHIVAIVLGADGPIARERMAEKLLDLGFSKPRRTGVTLARLRFSTNAPTQTSVRPPNLRARICSAEMAARRKAARKAKQDAIFKALVYPARPAEVSRFSGLSAFISANRHIFGNRRLSQLARIKVYEADR